MHAYKWVRSQASEEGGGGKFALFTSPNQHCCDMKEDFPVDEQELIPTALRRNPALGGLAAQRWGELRVALANSYLIGSIHIM